VCLCGNLCIEVAGVSGKPELQCPTCRRYPTLCACQPVGRTTESRTSNGSSGNSEPCPAPSSQGSHQPTLRDDSRVERESC
jgi:hypothetical protein